VTESCLPIEQRAHLELQHKLLTLSIRSTWRAGYNMCHGEPDVQAHVMHPAHSNNQLLLAKDWLLEHRSMILQLTDCSLPRTD
jgi:hypothetical protein